LTGTSPEGTTTTWIPSDPVAFPNDLVTEATLEQPTLFTLLVSDGYCTKTAQVMVKTFEFICDEPYVFVPNAFTPDEDNVNDILYVRGPYVYEMIFRIYNRWGEMVFESTDQSKGCDGTFKGRPCDPDVYDYYLDVYCVDGQQTIIKGNVTLIR
jgi:gliding motility-associated-like protein